MDHIVGVIAIGKMGGKMECQAVLDVNRNVMARSRALSEFSHGGETKGNGGVYVYTSAKSKAVAKATGGNEIVSLNIRKMILGKQTDRFGL